MVSEQLPSKPSRWPALASRLGPLLLVAGIVLAGWYAVHVIHSSDQELPPGEETAGTPGRLTLPDGKISGGKFQAEPVASQVIQQTQVVPGRVQYDETRHIEVKTMLEGILISQRVKPGDQVEQGHLLAVVNSPAIGEARAEVLKRQALLEIARRNLEREAAVAANLKEFFAELGGNGNLEELDRKFADRPLGQYRQEVQTSYSEYRLLNELTDNVRPLKGTGSIAEKTIRERESQLEVARAKYQAAREQAAFDAGQAHLEAQATFDDAERLLKISQRHVESLLGYPDSSLSRNDEATLSQVEIRAPFAGTIESRFKAENERVSGSDVLFVLADTSSLYVTADIRENNWPAVSLEGGREIQVIVPALDGEVFSATVHYIGREVNAATNAIPLVATIDNHSGLLRPGMFVKVVLPVGASRKTLAVHPSSILRHEDQSFVFIAVDENTFEKTNISTGLASEQWVEIKQGLRPGQQVVQQGAFLLKSELLLEGESE